MKEAEVVLNKPEVQGIYLLGLKVGKDYVNACHPGQFIKIKAWHSYDPLIPRPFTIHAVKEDRIYLLYQIKGKGTLFLSNLKVGDKVKISSPLGNPFPKLKNYIICAGGLGIAGFGFLLQSVQNGSYLPPEKLYYSARTKDLLVRLDFLKNFSVPLVLITEDGSLGKKGLITDVLEIDLKNKKPEAILACGPLGMLKAIATLGEKMDINTYVVLETFIGCGMGFCLGCVLSLKNGTYAYLCKDGPTFLGKELNFEEF